MKDRYIYNSPDGETVEVKPNLDTDDHNLYVKVEDGYDDACIGIVGKASIERFIYASAVHGGLIKPGETLTLRDQKTMPDDGAYYMGEGDTFCHVIVEGGRMYVPQHRSGVMLDCTEEYLRREDWVLRPMRKRNS